jgi:hypothetical protein
MITDPREPYLTEFASIVLRAAHDGKLDGRPLTIDEHVTAINGPRAGALEMYAGLDAGRLLNALNANDAAIARQLIPWDFKLDPTAYMSGRYVRLEAGWPDQLAERKIMLDPMRGARVMDYVLKKPGRWVAGKNEASRAVVPYIGDDTPHCAVSGVTRSGKTIALRSMIAQLAERRTQMVLIDGKTGDGLRGLDCMPGVVGPLAADLVSAKAALSWALSEMTHRYEQPGLPRNLLAVFIDEVQEFNKDKCFTAMVERIAAQGGAAGVSLVLATQHPSVENFGGPITKRQIGLHIALRVTDADASRVALGRSTPRADSLMGSGDAWIAHNGECQRCQIAIYDERHLAEMQTSNRQLLDWPEFDAEDALPDRWPGADELGAAIVLVSNDPSLGRQRFLSALKDDPFNLPGMSNDRANNLLKYARAINDVIQQHQPSVRPVEDAPSPPVQKAPKARRTGSGHARTDGRTAGGIA